MLVKNSQDKFPPLLSPSSFSCGGGRYAYNLSGFILVAPGVKFDCWTQRLERNNKICPFWSLSRPGNNCCLGSGDFSQSANQTQSHPHPCHYLSSGKGEIIIANLASKLLCVSKGIFVVKSMVLWAENLEGG
jgi:hypothetical protein